MLTITAAATVEPITVEQARTHLRLTHVFHDVLIAGLITAARESVERETGLSLAAASYAWTPQCDIAPSSVPTLPLRPATVTSADGVEPITFDTVPGILPPALFAAMLLIIGDLYENPSATITGISVAENPALRRLIYPHRLSVGV